MVKKIKRAKKKVQKPKAKKTNKNLLLVVGLALLIIFFGLVICFTNCPVNKKFVGLKPLNISNQVERVVEKVYKNGEVKQFAFYLNGKKLAVQSFAKDGAYKGTKGSIPDGLVYEYYKKNSLKAESRYEKGKRNGVERVYYPEGQLMGLLYFKNENLDPKAFVYYVSGELYSQWRYDAAVKKGTAFFYYKNGTKIIESECNTGDQYFNLVNRIQLEG